jgi:hypothetical protein
MAESATDAASVIRVKIVDKTDENIKKGSEGRYG